MIENEREPSKLKEEHKVFQAKGYFEANRLFSFDLEWEIIPWKTQENWETIDKNSRCFLSIFSNNSLQ